MEPNPKIKVALVDDHKLFRKGMVELVNNFSGYGVIWEANNGRELTQKFTTEEAPDIVLLDINMPEMDGYETAAWLKQHHPKVMVLTLSMYDHEEAIIKMLRAGAKGHILKDADPQELQTALQALVKKGFYYSELVSGTLLNSLNRDPENNKKAAALVKLNDRESEFLKLACTEFTYKEIADKMCLAPRTIDGYREALFEKLQVKSRIGLVLYAIKTGHVVIN
ncbi:response regulator transcription factor [Adhaeribacter rhizoryzae]|uniref:Response regulator transcription factor n=1 Tax=Adhaeribacter rhizoryzae TaxID=2607907 RepID=A0A5M6CTM6_9BACT|nr:response regulator transcription factor [Adhaeribacter rhizoryzae]KAA5538564.1 response regulator transcription factor [Adhaeribacter rhizoryzae]